MDPSGAWIPGSYITDHIPYKAEFLGFFYRDGVIKLTNFLQNATTDTQIKNDDYRTAHTYVFYFYCMRLCPFLASLLCWSC